ncbi:monovalent cation/H(+) antiporter subunit G [Kaustia mangrovi]|uniref:Monovalent cation/H(+) antiporter subunit G n=1 Tax=Kaustia mangrovi TaxID=2593653 RepID=A0A7S8HAW4_9HYPH|nr:monovalent cation/H(+) antiporter subunit G [Kaustia mangrovi]QPC42012.1 monovalent cation/H(+) antiporter subunit G [Kaustia mangrovi]
MMEVITGSLLLIGSFFSLTAAIGLVRLPDLYARMHAASKAGTLGVGILFLAIAVHFTELEITTRALAGIIFFILTAPVGAHVLARAAYFAGVAPWKGTQFDQLAGRYRQGFRKLDGYPFDSSDGNS